MRRFIGVCGCDMMLGCVHVQPRLVECTVMHRCFFPGCPICYPPGAIASNMKFSLHALSEIYKAKRLEYTGCQSYQTFPIDPRSRR
jgi:hypothetical protein